MKKIVVKANELEPDYTSKNVHDIYNQDNLGYVVNDVISKLRYTYGDYDVKEKPDGIHITPWNSYGFPKDVQSKEVVVRIQELPTNGGSGLARYEFNVFVDDKQVIDTYCTDSSERAYCAIGKAITDEINKKTQAIETVEDGINATTKIEAASNIGTVFYKTNAEQIIDVLKADEANPWLIAAFQNDGLDAIDFKHNLFGSFEYDGDLYICVTDGYEIEVNGEMIDPESSAEDYTVEQLAPYIQDATPEIIKEKITEYEIKPPFFDGWAADLLEGGYTFVDLMEAAQEFID